MKILWLTNMPTIYRVHFFNELGKACDLDVIFERYSATGVENKWNDKLAKYFSPLFIKSKPIGRESSISFDILKYINKNKKHDIIVVSSYSSPTEIIAIIKMILLKIPYIIAVDGGIIKNDSILLKKIKTFLIGNASHWLSTSESTDKYLQYYGAKKDAIYRYPFTTLFLDDIEKKTITIDEKLNIRNKLGIKGERVILAVGQFIYRKGFDILLKSCKNLDDNISVYIVGGEITDEYKELVKNLKLNNVNFIGIVSKEELKEYYKSADIFVLPTREDIWGLVINEAMANALPVITTDNCVSGIELINNYENGFIVPVDDNIELYNKIKLLMDEDVLREKISLNNLNKIKKYTIENMSNRHIEIFKQILGEESL